MKHPNKLSLIDCKIIVRKKPNSMSRSSKRKNQPKSIDNLGEHLPDYQTMQKRCVYCAT